MAENIDAKAENIQKKSSKPTSYSLNIHVILLSSILSSVLVYVLLLPRSNRIEKGSIVDKEKPYAEDHEDFLQFVEPNYNDSMLVEWEPAPKWEGDPKENGYMGTPTILTEEQEEIAKARESEHYFNVVASEMISLNRTVADLRVEGCLRVKYPSKLPQTSVVIVFRNEAWSTLLRTVWSVYRMSPPALLKEIILVDDASDMIHLQRPLEEYVETMPVRTMLVRSLTRAGLVQARLLGVKHAKAPTVTFLDAHCECNPGWLEPLLARIAENRQVAIAPIIDLISPKTFEIESRAIESMYSAFSWDLTFKWSRMPPAEQERINSSVTVNLRTPAMAGGLFAIDREFFYKIGAYDPKMKIWGAENIEMSIRLWSCGGAVETSQCSRVSHVFRATSPHSFPGGSNKVVSSNKARLVDVWLDEWQKFFYVFTPAARDFRSDVSERLKLRKNLKCKSFRWFLENIYPTSGMLTEVSSPLVSIENVAGSNMCLDTYGRKQNEQVAIDKCHFQGGNQIFMLTKKNEIRSDKSCLDAQGIDQPVHLLRCHGEMGNQLWQYDETTMTFQHGDGQNCLALIENVVKLAPCDDSDEQKWNLIDVYDEDDFEDDDGDHDPSSL